MMKNKEKNLMRINPKNGAVKLYYSTFQAAQELDLDPVTISHAALGLCGMVKYGGYRWAYKNLKDRHIPGPFAGFSHTDDTKNKMSDAKNKKKVCVESYTLDGQFVAGYESAAAAERDHIEKYGFGSHAGILRATNGGAKTYHGLVWRRAS